MQSIINCHVIYFKRYLKRVQTSCLFRWLHVDDVGVLFRWSIKLKGSGGVIIGLFLFFRCSVRATGATFAKHNI